MTRPCEVPPQPSGQADCDLFVVPVFASCRLLQKHAAVQATNENRYSEYKIHIDPRQVAIENGGQDHAAPSRASETT